MKKIKVLKQVTSIFLSFVLVFSVFGMYSYAAEPYIKAKEGSDIKIWDDIKYITGVHPIMTEDEFKSEFETVGCYLKITMKKSLVGTGTVVELLKSSDDSVIDTYTVILYGDIDGVGYHSLFTSDYKMYDTVIHSSNPEDTRKSIGEAAWLACDVNHDGEINVYDYQITKQARELYLTEFDVKTYSELKDDEKYIKYEVAIEQAVKPNLNTVFSSVKDDLQTAIKRYESTDFSNASMATYSYLKEYSKFAAEAYNAEDILQKDIDNYTNKLNGLINKALRIERDNYTETTYTFNKKYSIGEYPYFVWNKNTGSLTAYTGTESNNVKAVRDVFGYCTPWRSFDGDPCYVTDIIIKDAIYFETPVFQTLNNLKTIRLYDENIKINSEEFYRCSNIYGGRSTIVLYGVCDNHKKLAEKCGFKYKSLYDYSFESEPSANLKIDSENKIISGIRNGITADDLSYFDINSSGCDVVPVENSRATVGTGTKFNVVKWIDGSIADTYTAVLFGDVDGDGKYDGADAYKVNLMVNGHLTKEQVGNEIWAAADCNHDGVIDASDVALLERAGLLLSSIDQSKTPEELKSDEAYIEYESLIDQSAEPNADIVAEPDEPKEPETESESNLVIFIKKIVSFIKEIISKILSLIK